MIRSLHVLLFSVLTVAAGASPRAETTCDLPICGRFVAASPGYTTRLQLSVSGDYSLSASLYDGKITKVIWTESGRWSRDSVAIDLIPNAKLAHRDYPKNLRRLFPLENMEGGILLVSRVERNSHGEPRFGIMYIREDALESDPGASLDRPNKSLEPTSTSVMSPAGAGATPAVAVAHL